MRCDFLVYIDRNNWDTVAFSRKAIKMIYPIYMQAENLLLYLLNIFVMYIVIKKNKINAVLHTSFLPLSLNC